ncbi:glycosyltransferase family 4 protein [Prochlorococcus marinus]|uniref:Glycosyltransferase family 1 protein n=1 Tax=Prochlorococcus marinus XMU1408 TaxID=2213228 RepID=A0A318R5R2_PROMR|nr:glycosyltransferase family 1 protein [Prochlorococcus marinus]MBW3041106.1 glycosyltransferase family 1 protein [Prochlorococcus marinus str. XMU1408]PYE03709.1 glycosyltransferase family 1 protein [Prochlorococcus marinus XMU1408]
MSSIVFNGSYITKKNTGIGVVSKDLVTSLSAQKITTLIPQDIGIKGDIYIPNNLSPGQGLNSHLRRLYWLQQVVPKIMNKLNAEYFLSPLLEAPLFTNVKSIVLAHDLIPLRYPSMSFLTLYHLIYIPLILKQSKIILCNSNSTANDLNIFYKVPRHKLFPIKLGFNNKKYYPIKKIKKNFFLIIGRHNPHKNLERVIQAFSLAKIHNYKLVFVGPFDRRYTPRLMKIIEELNLKHLCVWKGWIDDEEKLLLLNECQALIIVSLWEGFGLPALEAMACGTPVIGSDRGALPEIIGKYGYLVNPFDIQSIAFAMHGVINDKKCFEKCLNEGPSQAASFNWFDTARSIEKIIDEIE